MADQEITELTALTTRVLTDLVPVEHNPSGATETVKMTIKDFLREAATELTIASDAITLTQLNHKLQPQSGTSDDLSTISGTTAGQSGVLYASDYGTDTITIKHDVGNILCMGAADITLSHGCVFWYSDGTKVFISGGGGGAGGSGVTLTSASPRVYTSGATWTKPAGLDYVIVEVIGGGGAGGGAVATTGADYSAGAGGGGGGYSKKKILAASLGATETVTVGAGGTGVSGGTGNSGGTSSFGAHCQATGGSGGNASTASAVTSFIGPGDGGIGSSGNINAGGAPGLPGVRAQFPHGGGGGNTQIGGGGVGQTTAAAFNGNAGKAYGGGGSGAANAASQTARAGAAGAAGVVIVWEYE